METKNLKNLRLFTAVAGLLLIILTLFKVVKMYLLGFLFLIFACVVSVVIDIRENKQKNLHK